MELVLFLAPWVLLGVGVLFIAFSGNPAKSRRRYFRRAPRAFKIAMPLLFVVGGIAAPAIVIVDRDKALGDTGPRASKEQARGAELFKATCASCHSLAAANARGVTGPNLDELGVLEEKRVLEAIRVGGTGNYRMPAGLLEDEDAVAVAKYVSEVAGKE